MKTRLHPFLYAALLAASIFSCKKDNDPQPQNISKIVFWSANDNIQTIKVDCYVDNKLIGTLTRLTDNAPDCSDSKSPVATVEPGTHTCVFKAGNGQTIDIDLTTQANTCYNVELE